MKINRQTYKAIAISLVTCSLILTSPRDASALQLPVPAELSGLIAQVNQLITSINSGDYLPQVQAAITQSIGQLGIPDPSKAEAAVLASIKGVFNSTGLNGTFTNQGMVTASVTNTSVQNVLGEDGQARLKKTLEEMMLNAQNVGQLSLNTSTGAQTNAAIANTAQQIAANSVSFAQSAFSSAQQVDLLSKTNYGAVAAALIGKLKKQIDKASENPLEAVTNLFPITIIA